MTDELNKTREAEQDVSKLLKAIDDLKEELIEALRDVLAYAPPTISSHEYADEKLRELGEEGCPCPWCLAARKRLEK